MKYILNSAKLRGRRAELDYSKAKLSVKSGVSLNTLYAMEHNPECNPTIRILGRVCEALGLELADVILKVDEKEGG